MSNQTTKKSIHDGHRERVRENVLKNGFEQLEDHRLLELLLFYSIPRGDTNELAHKLLNEFGSLSCVLKASPKKLMKVSGIGEGSAIYLSAMGELCVRAMREKSSKRVSYKSDESLKRLAESYYFNETKERFLVLGFDSGMKLVLDDFISEGDSIRTDFDIKHFVSIVIESDADYIMLVHNHPDGEAYPSGADLDTTAVISTMLKKLSVGLLDHIIIGSDRTLSVKNETTFSSLFTQEKM